MILIPFLYSIFFLKSVWDPYGDTQNLPVAVVNEDKSVNYQGEKFAVGKQVVTNLKKITIWIGTLCRLKSQAGIERPEILHGRHDS